MSAVCENAKAGHCPICLELDPDVMVLCCGTSFHVACVAHWLQEPAAEPTCPTCYERLRPPPPVVAAEDSFWSEPSFMGPGPIAAEAVPDLEENQRAEVVVARPAPVDVEVTVEVAEGQQRAAVHPWQAPPRAVEPGPFYMHGRRVLGDLTNTVSSRPMSAAAVAAANMAAAELRAAAPELRAAAPERRDVVMWRTPAGEGLNLSMPPQINVQQIGPGSPMPNSPQPRSPTFLSPPPNALRSGGLSITPEPVPMPQAVQQHLRRAAGRGQGAASSSAARCSPAAASYVPCRPLR